MLLLVLRAHGITSSSTGSSARVSSSAGSGWPVSDATGRAANRRGNRPGASLTGQPLPAELLTLADEPVELEVMP